MRGKGRARSREPFRLSVEMEGLPEEQSALPEAISAIQRNRSQVHNTSSSAYSDLIGLLPQQNDPRSYTDRDSGLPVQNSRKVRFSNSMMLSQDPNVTDLPQLLSSQHPDEVVEGVANLIKYMRQYGNAEQIKSYLRILDKQILDKKLDGWSIDLRQLCGLSRRILGAEFSTFKALAEYPGSKIQPIKSGRHLTFNCPKLSFCQISQQSRIEAIEQLSQNVNIKRVVFGQDVRRIMEQALADCSDKVILGGLHTLESIVKYWRSQAYGLARGLLSAVMSKLSSSNQMIATAALDTVLCMFEFAVGIADVSPLAFKFLQDNNRSVKQATLRLILKLMPALEQRARPDKVNIQQFAEGLSDRLMQLHKDTDQQTRRTALHAQQMLASLKHNLKKQALLDDDILSMSLGQALQPNK